MEIDNNAEDIIAAQRPDPNPRSEIRSRTSSFHPQAHHTSPSQENFILSVASKIAFQPIQNSDPNVWGVLTAISAKARKRHQGINIILSADEHCIGRIVDDRRFQIESIAVCANHCKIYRKKVSKDEEQAYAALRDTSTNGTFLNAEKLNKSSPEVILCHGDIISFAAAPHHENAFAFVYREVHYSTSLSVDGAVKRKAEEFGVESKRLRGIGIGAPEGPISLDDFRSLQRSNTNLRKQLEDQVSTIEALRSENRTASEHHENEMKVLKESVSKSFVDQLNKSRHMLENKDKELLEINRISAEQKRAMETLNERLGASIQSCSEANEIVNSFQMGFNPLYVILKENKLTGPNYIDWKRNLDILLTTQQYIFCTFEECPPIPADSDTDEVKDYHKKWLNADEMTRCYILTTMSGVLQHQHQAMRTASDMLYNIKELFGSQNRVARQIAMKALMNTTMAEGTSVRDHVLKMMGHLNEMEILGAEIDGETQIDIILMSLPKSFEQFCLNYNMNKRLYSLAELLTELHAAECLFPKYVQVHVAEKGSSSKLKGNKKKKKAQPHSRAASKGIGSQGALKKSKGKCFKCNAVGHWKGDCPLKVKNTGVSGNQGAK